LRFRSPLRIPAAPDEETAHLRLKFGERAIERPAAGIEYDRPLVAQERQLKPDGFANASAQTVADDGLAQRAGRGEADAQARRCGIRETESREKGTRVARAVVVDLSEIAGSQQPDTFGEGRSIFDGGFDGGLDRGRGRKDGNVRDSRYLSELTLSFLRPAARRRESTACPSAVFMRVRKPCVLARRRLFG